MSASYGPCQLCIKTLLVSVCFFCFHCFLSFFLLTNFHAKKVAYITQEILARMIMYNFCELITTSVILSQKDTKHNYQVNYTMAIHICRYFLKLREEHKPPAIEALIRRYILPVRTGRHDPRKVRIQGSVSFLYRVA